MDDSLIVEIWDTFKEYIPEKSREMAATQYVDFLSDLVEIEELGNFLGYDAHLDVAINEVLNQNSAYEKEEDVDEIDDEDY
jgi:hypothetical protein